MDKVLKIIFVILILITVGEVAFYLYRFKPSVLRLKQIPFFAQKNVIPTPQGGDYAFLNRLTNKSTNVASQVDLKFEGKIKKVGKNGKGNSTVYRIEIYASDPSSSESFSFPGEEGQHLQVVHKSADKEIPITFGDLKVDDNVVIENVFDLKKSRSVIDKIIKL